MNGNKERECLKTLGGHRDIDFGRVQVLPAPKESRKSACVEEFALKDCVLCKQIMLGSLCHGQLSGLMVIIPPVLL